jgi:hypothetical protein
MVPDIMNPSNIHATLCDGVQLLSQCSFWYEYLTAPHTSQDSPGPDSFRAAAASFGISARPLCSRSCENTAHVCFVCASSSVLISFSGLVVISPLFAAVLREPPSQQDLRRAPCRHQIPAIAHRPCQDCFSTLCLLSLHCHSSSDILPSFSNFLRAYAAVPDRLTFYAPPSDRYPTPRHHGTQQV